MKKEKSLPQSQEESKLILIRAYLRYLVVVLKEWTPKGMGLPQYNCHDIK